jgi:hypothetical protein
VAYRIGPQWRTIAHFGGCLGLELRVWCGEPSGENYGRRAEVAKGIGVRRGLIGDWLAGRALPGWENGLKLQAFLKKQRRKNPN